MSQDDSRLSAPMSTIDFASINAVKAGRASVAVGRTQNGRMSVPLAFGKSLTKVDPATQKKMELEEMDEKYGLPDTWARHSSLRTKKDNCDVCESPFSMVSAFGMGTRDFYCKQCGFAVCAACSTNKKYLSKDGKEKFRVCDLCDTKLDNIKLRLNFEKFLTLKDDKIDMTTQLLARLKDQKKVLEAEIEAEKLTQKVALDQVALAMEKEKSN